MALRSTVLKAQLSLSDLDRNHFSDYSLVLAQHPSETVERVMVRLLAFALNACQDLKFGRGLSNEEDAAVWEVDPAGEIRHWIDVGQPDETRIKKACSRADKATLIVYGSKADLWFRQNSDFLMKYSNLQVLQLTVADSATLTRTADKNMKLEWTIQEGTIYLGDADITPLVLKVA